MIRLLKHNLRLILPVLLTAVAFWIIISGVTAFAIFAGTRHPLTLENYRNAVVGMTLGWLFASVIVSPAVGGAAFALERQQRWSDFVGVLPISRSAWILTKLLSSVFAFLMIMLVPLISLFGSLLLLSPHLNLRQQMAEGDLVVVLAASCSTFAAFGIAWWMSTYFSSPTYPTVIGLVAILAVYMGIYFWNLVSGFNMDNVMVQKLQIVMVGGGVATILFGIRHQLNRAEP